MILKKEHIPEMSRVEELNYKYRSFSPIRRLDQLFRDFPDTLITSSFGTTSVFLLHLVSRVDPERPVYFLDTGYHFPETLAYKQTLTEMLNLNVVSIGPEDWKHDFTKSDRTWEKDPDFCCSVNKVEPLDALRAKYQVWVSGLMRFRETEKTLENIFEEKNGKIKCYPLIDLPKEAIFSWMDLYRLPQHPLQSKGYQSIGCSHCTLPGKGRSGRWTGKGKTECGIHL